MRSVGCYGNMAKGKSLKIVFLFSIVRKLEGASGISPTYLRNRMGYTEQRLELKFSSVLMLRSAGRCWEKSSIGMGNTDVFEGGEK